MPVNLSIKNVPDDVAERLRQRAKRNHRSLQGELLHLLEESLATGRLSPAELHAKVSKQGRISFEEFDRKMAKLDFHTAGDSTEIIRHDRDTR